MRARFLGGVFIFLILFACVTSPGAENWGGASADVPEPSFNFGSAVEGTDVIHDFIIRNAGDAPLMIDGVKTG